MSIAATHAAPPSACYATLGAVTIAQPAAPALRAQSIAVVGRYAVVRAGTDPQARESALVQQAGRWCVLGVAPGAYSTDDLVRLHVPRTAAEQLFAQLQHFRTGKL